MYVFTPKIKELMPELYREHMNSVNSEIMNLWEKGYLDLDLFAVDPVVSLTNKALNPADISKLSYDERTALNEIRRVLLDRNI